MKSKKLVKNTYTKRKSIKKNRKSPRKYKKLSKKNRKSMKGGMQSIIKKQDKNIKNLYDFNIPNIQPRLQNKIQYVFVNAHGSVIDTHESIAIKNPRSLIPKSGPNVNKRILTNSFCGTLDYNILKRNDYMAYLLNLYNNEGLDVLWSFTDKQEEKFREIDKLLYPKNKKYITPLTHLGRTSTEKYFFTYDHKFQETYGETFGIFLFTKFNKGYNGIGDTPVFQDLTEDIYEYIHKRKIYKVYSDKQYTLSKKKEPIDLDFVLKSQRPYGYSSSMRNDNGLVTLTSEDIIKYFEEKHNTIVRIISGSCRGSPKKRELSKKYSMKGEVIPYREGTKIPSDVGPRFNNNVTRTISGVKNSILNTYIAPGKILIILIDASGTEHRLELDEYSSGSDVIKYVEKKLKIPSKDQYYFANIAHYDSQLNINAFEDLSLLYLFGYKNNKSRIRPYNKKNPIYMYILNYGQYYDIFNEKIPNKLYPSFPKNIVNDPRNTYPDLFYQSKL